MKRKIYFTGLGLLYGFFVWGQDSVALRYSGIIDPGLMRKHLTVLTADSLEGRETSKPGMVKAANYVASQFRAMNMPPLANGTYFQEFPLNNLILGHMTINLNNKEYSDTQDFYMSDGDVEMKLNADEIVFAGYGIKDSVSGWNDYSKLDVKDKVVMMLDGEPRDKSGKSLITHDTTASDWSKDRSLKITAVSGMKPRAILYVNKNFSEGFDKVKRWVASGRVKLSGEQEEGKSVVITITEAMADDFLRRKGTSVNKYAQKISKKKKPLNFLINEKISIMSDPPKVSCRNVLGYLEGSDLKDEVVVVTAHLDHLGIKNDKIYRGADDDGSGVSALLAIAQAFATAKAEGHGPRRSILFMTFSGEEKGLLGSRYYTNHPVFPLAKTVVDLNVDMIGRIDTLHTNTDYVYIIGSEMLSKKLHKINVNSNAEYTKLQLDYKYNDPNDKLRLYYRSDHYNFAKKNIPVIFYFTGLHADYHKPTDTIDKIDFNKAAVIAKLIYYTAWNIAGSDVKLMGDK